MQAKKKNPLSWLFGEYLRQERNQLGETGDEMAQKLDLGASFYRMIESGNANMHPNKCIHIIHALRESHIEFGRLCKLLVGIQYIEYYIKRDESPQFALAALGSIDKEYKSLNNATQPLFNDSTDDESKKNFVQRLGVKEIEQFLGKTYYVPNEARSYETALTGKLRSTRGLTLELTMDILATLSKHPPMHISGYAQNWENENATRFVSLIGMYKNSDLIISEENLSKFHFLYLFKKQFKDIKFIFLDTTKSKADSLKKKFISLYNDLSSKEKRTPLSPTEIDKLHFIGAKNYRKEDLDYFFRADPPDESMQLAAYWSFSTLQGTEIAFVGVKKEDIGFVSNLSYNSAINKKKDYLELWEKLKL